MQCVYEAFLCTDAGPWGPCQAGGSAFVTPARLLLAATQQGPRITCDPALDHPLHVLWHSPFMRAMIGMRLLPLGLATLRSVLAMREAKCGSKSRSARVLKSDFYRILESTILLRDCL